MTTPRPSKRPVSLAVPDQRDQWFKDIQIIYQQAMHQEHYAIALRAKTLMAQAHGWLKITAKQGLNEGIKPLHEWTPADIDFILKELAHYDQLDSSETKSTDKKTE